MQRRQIKEIEEKVCMAVRVSLLRVYNGNRHPQCWGEAETGWAGVASGYRHCYALRKACLVCIAYIYVHLQALGCNKSET